MFDLRLSFCPTTPRAWHVDNAAVAVRNHSEDERVPHLAHALLETASMSSSDAVGSAADTALWRGLSAEAVRGYSNSTEAMQAAVRLIGEQLGMRTGWLNGIDCGGGAARVLAAYNAPGGSGVEAGGTLPLPDLF